MFFVGWMDVIRHTKVLLQPLYPTTTPHWQTHSHTHTCTLSIKLITKNTTHFSYTLAADWPRYRSYTNTFAHLHVASETDKHMPDCYFAKQVVQRKIYYVCSKFFAQENLSSKGTKKYTAVVVERSDGDGDK